MTILKADTSIVLDVDRPSELFCAYEHYTTELIMVGACKLVDVYRMADAKSNTEWQRTFSRGGYVNIRIIAVGDNRTEMARYAQTYLRSLPTIPRCNLHGITTRGFARPIRCENTQVVYKSQRDACEQLGIESSSMSRHLNGRLSRVHGMVFRYADEDMV
jgi:hypothetical protein